MCDVLLMLEKMLFTSGATLAEASQSQRLQAACDCVRMRVSFISNHIAENARMLVIPTYDERDNIASLVTRIRNAAGAQPILFVDDNSPDGTAAEIRRLQDHDPDIHLLARPGKGGFSSACRDGMKQVLRRNLAPYLILMDADLSHPPESLPRMIELLKANPVVIGSRYVKGGATQGWNFRRRSLSFGANLYARLLTGVPAHDLTAGFVGYQADVLRNLDLDRIHSEGYAFQMELKFHLHRMGVSLCEFPIIFSERRAGNSKFTRKILLEGIGFPIRALGMRIAGTK
jgi:dolichol-phosphate mannosyltransferase